MSHEETDQCAADAVVREQLMGMAAAHPELKVRIEPHYITRADSPVMGKVALVSGGGSATAMHGGLVGKGMLDGACPGEIFTSPTPDQMYECGQAVDGGAGVLFLVKNYTGDVLNFKPRSSCCGDGVKVGFSLIDDDVAVKDASILPVAVALPPQCCARKRVVPQPKRAMTWPIAGHWPVASTTRAAP